jgi:hypothetical protein
MSRQEKLAALASTGVTKAELDNIDGGTSRGTTAIADGDGVLINDAGTMRMTSVETMATYMGTKITGGSMVYLASSGAISSGTASVSFTQFDASKYDHYQFHMQHILPVTDAQYLWARVSTDGGSNYDATNGNYHRNATTDATAFWIARSAIGNASGEFGASGIFYLFAPHNSSVGTYATSTGVMMGTSSSVVPLHGPHGEATGVHLTTADVDAIQFLFESGNIASGEIVMYGIANGT